MGNFFQDFNRGLADVEKATGTTIQVDGKDWPVISIDKLSVMERGMSGGEFADASTVVHLRTNIYNAAGLKSDKALTAYGERLRVLTIEKEGDDAVTLICGPSGVDIQGF